jgi:hypothetical protein
MRDDPFGAVLRSKRPAFPLAPVQLLACPIVTRLLAGGIAPRDHYDAAYGVMGPPVLRGCCSKAIAEHDMLTERMRHMIDDVLSGGFLSTICGTDS